MSRSTNFTYTCPCGTVVASPIYEYVNTARDPQLRYTVLAGLLNVATCPMCNRRAALARPFIYSDPDHSLLAYIHPQSDVPEEARLLILEKLRSVYQTAEAASIHEGSSDIDKMPLQAKRNGRPTKKHTSSQATEQSKELPPLQIVFGLDQLNELINATLSQDERLGRLALSTHSRNEAERGQMLDIARKLASEMHCQVEVEDLPGEYTVWMYGSRRHIGALMRELAPRG